MNPVRFRVRVRVGVRDRVSIQDTSSLSLIGLVAA